MLVPPRDARALAEAILRVWRSPVLRARLEAGVRALAANFSRDRIARQTAAFVDCLRGG